MTAKALRLRGARFCGGDDDPARTGRFGEDAGAPAFAGTGAAEIMVRMGSTGSWCGMGY